MTEERGEWHEHSHSDPAVRVSEQVQPEFRVFSHEADALHRRARADAYCWVAREADAGKTSVFRYSLEGGCGRCGAALPVLQGREGGRQAGAVSGRSRQVPATGLIDGCWISICHWSEQEAVFLNSNSKNADEGISNGISRRCPFLGARCIQNVFDSSHYVGRHEMTLGEL